MKRKAYVAGQFYPGSREKLRETIAAMTDPAADKKKALALVSPHAGYVYSGAVAGRSFRRPRCPASSSSSGRDIARSDPSSPSRPGAAGRRPWGTAPSTRP